MNWKGLGRKHGLIELQLLVETTAKDKNLRVAYN
jgi:hypothetical protein